MITALRLLEVIGEIDDIFLHEAETADAITVRANRRKRIVKYSVAGFAVSVGLAAMAYWRFRPRVAKAAA